MDKSSGIRGSLSHAVILAGGRGERLRPLTDSVPKPMVPIGDRPFLWFLCDQLAKQGFREITILGGYLGATIEAWARTSPLGGRARIDVRVTPAEWDPIARLREGRAVLPDRFLLLYGDNFISFLYDKMRLQHAVHKGTVSMLIGSKEPGNVEVMIGRDEIRYHRKRGSGYKHVDLGFMAVETERFFSQTDSCQTLSQALAKLSNSGEVEALEHLDCYYSVSDYPRYLETAKFLVPKKVVLLDRDGTINVKPARGTYVTKAEEFVTLPAAREGLTKLGAAGFSFVVISNQAGIATGDLTVDALDCIHRKMRHEFESIRAPLLGVYYCPAHWEDRENPDRKPQAGMFRKLSRDLMLRLDELFYVGDDVRDMLAAWNANCIGAYIGDQKELETLTPEQWPKIIGRSLKDIADQIIEYS